jgi:predicted nucleic acid-binding protein
LIVVDTNVVAYLLIEGDRSAQAQQLWTIDPEWHLPVLWRHEFLNTLATLTKTGRAELDQVQEVWTGAVTLLSFGERDVEMPQALELAVRHRISAYDAQYVALAASLGVPLITEDQKLLRAFPDRLLSIQDYCELHASSRN